MRADPRSLKAIYLKHTDYHRFPGGLKKLEFIVEVLCGLDRDPATVSVLDVGCGNGGIALPVASLGYRVLGVDVDAGSIEHARRVNEFPNARFELVEGSRFDFGERFDVVICSEVLEHLHDPIPLIRTIARLMKDDALSIITVPNGQGPREVLGRVENFLKDTLGLKRVIVKLRKLIGMADPYEKCFMHTSNVEQPGTGHVQFFSLPGIRKRLERGGLDVVKVVKSLFLFSVLFKSSGDKPTAVNRFDNQLTERLPASMASGWFLLCKKTRS